MSTDRRPGTGPAGGVADAERPDPVRLYPPFMGPVAASVLVAVTLLSLAVAVGAVARLMAVEGGGTVYSGPMTALALALGLIALLSPILARLVIGRHVDRAAERLAALAARQGTAIVSLPLPKDAMARVAGLLDALEAQGRGLPVAGLESGETDGELRLRVARSALPAFNRLADLLTEALEAAETGSDRDGHHRRMEALARRVEAGADEVARMLVEQETQLREALAVVLDGLAHARDAAEPGRDGAAREAESALLPAIADTLALVDARQERLHARFDVLLGDRETRDGDLRGRLDALLAALDHRETAAGDMAADRSTALIESLLGTSGMLATTVAELGDRERVMADLLARLEQIAGPADGRGLDAALAGLRRRLEAADALLERYDARLTDLTERFRRLGATLADRAREAMEEADAALETLSGLAPATEDRLDRLLARLERAADRFEADRGGGAGSVPQAGSALDPALRTLRDSVATLQSVLAEQSVHGGPARPAPPPDSPLADLDARIGRMETALQELVARTPPMDNRVVTSLEDRLQDRRRP